MVNELQEKLRRWEEARRPAGAARTSTGCEPLDRLFPEGGVARGTLVEWLAEGEGGGALWLALMAARQACQEHGPLVVIDGRGTFYPPAAVMAGIDPQRLIVVRVTLARDESWALDQALRSGGAGAVLCLTDRLSQRGARRLQLAAEAGGGVGFLVRPASVRGEPCWAEVRLLVEPCRGIGGKKGTNGQRTARCLAVEVLKTRGTLASELAEKKRLELEIDDETGIVRVVARLDPAAAHRRSSGA
ncbi:MAG: hypothetical protein B7Z73_04240 [Planctomycetia bacterium 21-64-5]|nr:MAG: hypothetical protein B7Z73_04240 [Planctomycetia bacterium 21-64-5]